MTHYQIVFDPELEINPADFIEIWNIEHRELAEAQTMTTQRTDFAVEPVTTVTAALLGIGLGLTTHAIYDAVKETIKNIKEKRSPHSTNHAVELQEIPQEDGGRLLVVTIRQPPI